MAEQPITVTVEGIAATLNKLSLAAHALERYKSLNAAGPEGGSSQGFRSSLDIALQLFGANVAELQLTLRELRNAVKETGQEIIELDSEYGHLHTTLNNQLSHATNVTPPKNALL